MSMAAYIRLRRIGKNPKKKPFFRLGVYDQRQGRDARSIEELGYYNPVSGTKKIRLERVEHWVKQGAQLTDAARSLVKRYKKEVKNATGTDA
jgi:small subunit ribosomal protein S16